MRGNQVAMYVGSLLFAALFRTALALPHEVEATPRMTDALTLALFVKSSESPSMYIYISEGGITKQETTTYFTMLSGQADPLCNQEQLFCACVELLHKKRSLNGALTRILGR